MEVSFMLYDIEGKNYSCVYEQKENVTNISWRQKDSDCEKSLP